MAAPSRFASVTEEEFAEILKNKDAENTIKSTKNAVTIFKAYLREKEKPLEFETLDKLTLATLLQKFYIELRKADGDYYKTASMNGIRAGLNRHLKNEWPGLIDIIKDAEFTDANVAFKAALVKLKNIGKGDVQHHSQIDKNDIEKMYKSGVFDQASPTGLFQKVWFELMLYICRRGRENLRSLKRDHFVVETDSDGREYVTQAVDELTKKTREDNQDSRADCGRMYATNTDDCPVASFKNYISKLNPNCEAFFQTPKLEAPKDAELPWFKNSPVGQVTLGNIMSRLSVKAGLSKVYTNHCIRVTCISILDGHGFATRDICKVSGHANESSLASYVGRMNDGRRQDMSDALSRSLGYNPVVPVTPEPSVSYMPSPQPADPVDVNSFESQDLDLELSSSQLAFIEEVVHSEEVHHMHTEQSGDLTTADMSAQTPSGSSAASTMSSSTSRHTMQLQTLHQQAPFVLHNCSVTINYYNSMN